MLGSFDGSSFLPLRDLTVSAHCNRVPVIDGAIRTCIRQQLVPTLVLFKVTLSVFRLVSNGPPHQAL